MLASIGRKRDMARPCVNMGWRRGGTREGRRHIILDDANLIGSKNKENLPGSI
jgi:hypothetical protein